MRLLFAAVLMACISNSALAAVKLPANTVIAVRATEPIDGKSVKAGSEIVLVVASNVVVNGETLVKAGAPVIAFVDNAKESQMAGIAGNISVSFRSTVAVDGQTIPITGTMLDTGDSEVGSTVAVGVILCPLALLNKGKAGRIAPGTEVRGLTVGEYQIDFENPVEIQYMSTDYVIDEKEKREQEEEEATPY